MSQHPLVRERLPWHRRLHVEPLEVRRLLAVVTVGNDLDVVNGDTSSIASLISNDGGDGISLREAILAANATSGADVINFAAALSGGTISLNSGELQIAEALTIDAEPLSEHVTIDGQQRSRIFNITATTGDFTFGGLSLTGGRTTKNNADFNDTTQSGGAIRSVSKGNLTLRKSIVSGNSTTGDRASGGGVFSSGAATLTESTVSGNSTAGYSAPGGGVFSAGAATLTESTVSGNSTTGNYASGGGIHTVGSVTLTRSTVSGNSTAGYLAHGGGISADGDLMLTQSTVSGNITARRAYGGGINSFGSVTLTWSTVSNNSTAGFFASGGGIGAAGRVTLTQSTVSGNSTAGEGADGGGIFAGGDLTLTQSTVSGNSTAGYLAHGGGILAGGGVTLMQSTVTNNHAAHPASRGGGIFGGGGGGRPVSISGSILAGNTAGGGADLVPDPQSALTVNYSLIGTGIAPTAGGNNVVTDNPQLGPLANNGGATLTHAPLPGSPVINAGDPNAVAGMNGVPLYDQRGAPFARVAGGRIDIGAVESQPIPPAAFGDYNADGAVDAVDYVVWRNSLGSNVPPFSGADGSGNGLVDQSDYQVWRSDFGKSLPAPAVAAAMHNEAAASPLASDAWFGLFAVEAGTRSAAPAIAVGSAAVPTYPSGTVDLLLVLDAVQIDEDTVPLGTDALDAAFSVEDDEADLSDPSAVSLASL